MAAILAPRVEKLEKDHAILRRDHDCLSSEVHDPKRGLAAAHERLDDNDVLSAQVKIAIGVMRWFGVLVGGLIVALLWNILVHAVIVTVP